MLQFRYEATKLTKGTDIPRLYNLKEVSVMLDIPIGTLYNMSYRNLLPCIKLGKRIKLTEEHIKQILAKKGSLYAS